jgi:acetyl-CoA carboxylase biotin carboxyl carrier protein
MTAKTTTPQSAEAEQTLESLCKQARQLATGLPGALTRLTVAAGDNRVDMEWLPGAAPAGLVVANGAAAPAAANGEAGSEEVSGYAIVAPLVGTFYRSPDPDSAPFVSEGDIVEVGQQVAIVEAMKIMNAVQAEQGGRVVKILASAGDMVEYGQPLIILAAPDAEE